FACCQGTRVMSSPYVSYLFSFFYFSSLIMRLPSRATLFPYTTLFRSRCRCAGPIVLRAREFSPAPLIISCAESPRPARSSSATRSEEHTSELQSRRDLVCRLLLEKKKNTHVNLNTDTTHLHRPSLPLT